MKNKSVKMILKSWSLEGKGNLFSYQGDRGLVAKLLKRVVSEQLIRTVAITQARL